jgi:hypothetical protein
MSTFIPFAVLWVVLAFAVLALVVYRRSIASHEDTVVHLTEAGPVGQQVNIAEKLAQIDKWGKTLTIVLVAYGLILGALFLYHSWVAGATAGV